MNLQATIQIYGGGKNSGPTAPCPQCGPGKGTGSSEAHEKSYNPAKGTGAWQGAGFGKSGRKQALNAVIKSEYFAWKQGFTKTGTEEGRRTGAGLTKMQITKYNHPDGHELTIEQDPSNHRVWTKLKGPKAMHNDLEKTLARRDANKMLYEQATRQKR